MKIALIKSFVMLLFIAAFSNIHAVPDHPEKEMIENVRSQIIHHLEKPDLTEAGFDQVEAMLHFMINKESEIVVIYVDANDEFLDRYLKERLNYKKIKNNILRGPYSMKVTVKNARA